MLADKFGPARKIELTSINDSRGMLVVGEVETHVPFTINRFFIVAGVPAGVSRGIHAHKKCHQFLVCVRGSVIARIDNGKSSKEMLLSNPNFGLYMPPMTWGTQYSYSNDAVLLVFASHAYDQEDYIHDYDEFLNQLGAQF